MALPDIHEDPDRLRRPVRARWTGGSEIDWDEALDLVVEGLARRSPSTGGTRSPIYLGNPNVHSLGAMTHGTAMVEGVPHAQHASRATSVDQLPRQLLAYLMYGHQLLLPIPDIDRTDLVPGVRRATRWPPTAA